MLKRFPLVLLVLLTAAAVTAEEKSFTLLGKSTLNYMRLQLRVQDSSMKAVRVYAQPSNTLLGVFVNEDGPEPMSKSKWLEQTFPSDQRPERFPLGAFAFRKDATMMVRSDLPKPGDDRLEVYIYRGGKKKEEKIEVRDNPTDFTFEK
jgi:hypothetical protein